jgi:hypothetical protein
VLLANPGLEAGGVKDLKDRVQDTEVDGFISHGEFQVSDLILRRITSGILLNNRAVRDFCPARARDSLGTDCWRGHGKPEGSEESRQADRGWVLHDSLITHADSSQKDLWDAIFLLVIWTRTKACELLPNRSNSLSNPVILLKFSKTTKNLALPGIFCNGGQPKLAHACPSQLGSQLVEVLLSKGHVEQTLSLGRA